MFKTETDLTDESWRAYFGKMFPAIMNQDDDSTNQRILNIIADVSLQQKNNLLKISDSTSIDKAEGKTLTDLAKDWGVTRIDDDDDFLRFQLRVQYLKSHLGISTDDLIKLISMALGIEENSFNIVGTDNPEEIVLTDVVFDIQPGPKMDLKRELIINSIQSLLPPEYKLKDIEYAESVENNLYMAVVTTISANYTVREDSNVNRQSVEITNQATNSRSVPLITVKEME